MKAKDIRVAVFRDKNRMNEWLEENGEVEIVDIRFSICPYQIDNGFQMIPSVEERFMVIYRAS